MDEMDEMADWVVGLMGAFHDKLGGLKVLILGGREGIEQTVLQADIRISSFVC